MSEPSPKNVAGLATVLAGFGISLDPSKLARPKIQAPLKGQLSGIESLTSISEVSFGEAFEAQYNVSRTVGQFPFWRPRGRPKRQSSSLTPSLCLNYFSEKS